MTFHSGMLCLYSGKITGLRDLLNELRTVTQWYLLGIYLGLHPSTLDAIRKDYVDTEECRTQMLIEWQKCVIPTWSAVVKALVGIGRERFASHLATKYGIQTHVLTLITYKLPDYPSLFQQESPFQTLMMERLWKH